MNSFVKKIKKERMEYINSRLDEVTPKDTRDFFLERGFFPEGQYLPSDFFTSDSLLDNNYKPSRLYDGNEFRSKNVDRESGPTTFYYPKTKYTLRALSVPPLENYFLVVDFIKKHWDKFRDHLKLNPNTDSIIPYSYPLFYPEKKRSEVDIKRYKLFQNVDVRGLSNYFNIALHTDIKDFYSSIYTHTLAWALNEETQEPDHQNEKRWENNFDLLIRRLNQNKTKGILIGPYVSDFASEILLRSLDKTFSEEMEVEDFIGFRFKDDYFFLTENKNDANKIRKKIQKIFDNFHLTVNGDKTNIIKSDELSKGTKMWKPDLAELRAEIEEHFDNSDGGTINLESKKLDNWLKQINRAYDNYKDPYLVKSVLGKLVEASKDRGVKIVKSDEKYFQQRLPKGEVYQYLFANFYSLCKEIPSAYPLFLAFIGSCYKGAEEESVNSFIEEYLEYLTKIFLKNDESLALIWELYVKWRCEIETKESTQEKIKEKYQDNWLVMSLLDPEYGIRGAFGEEFNLVEANRENAESISEVISVFGYPSFRKEDRWDYTEPPPEPPSELYL